MNVDDLLIQSLQLLGLGMGSVFVILSMLIVVVTLISRIVPEDIPSPITPAQEANQESLENKEHIAAIQAAIHQFRRSRSQ